ncbi:MAG: hypothetical protein M4D80_04500 [Myxococcota bacterium]|nr:hypothetical protein [Deltaproteobacteria bacterium]MDQ3334400.1 hypothetical protein [Myxococcota bacterium]
MKRRLHLVRAGEPPVLDASDWVVYLPSMRLAEQGAPPQPPGPITHEQLVALIFAADLVVTW